MDFAVSLQHSDELHVSTILCLLQAFFASFNVELLADHSQLNTDHFSLMRKDSRDQIDAPGKQIIASKGVELHSGSVIKKSKIICGCKHVEDA
jgi:hypothetical protein